MNSRVAALYIASALIALLAVARPADGETLDLVNSPGFRLEDLTSADLAACERPRFNLALSHAKPPATSACSDYNVREFCLAFRTEPIKAPAYSCAPALLRLSIMCASNQAGGATDCQSGVTTTPAALAKEAVNDYGEACESLAKEPDPGKWKVEQCFADAMNDRAPRNATAGGLESIILVGATDFFVGYAKATLVQFFKEQLFESLCEDSDSGVKVLPNTCAALSAADASTVSISSLRSAFQADLKLLPLNLMDELDIPASPVACVARIGAQVGVSMVADGSKVSSALKGALGGAKPKVCPDEFWSGVTIAKAVLDDALESSPVDLKTKILGAVQQLRALDVADKWIEKLIAAAERFSQSWIDASSPSATSENKAALAVVTFELVGATVTVAAAAAEARIAKLGNGGALPSDYHDDASKFAKNVNEFAKNVTALGNSFAAILRGDYVLAALQLLSLKLFGDLIPATKAGVVKFIGSLQTHIQAVATIAAAQKPEDVERALESAAAPIGSWREFRRRPGAVFVSAMLGIGFGVEGALEAPGNPGAFIGPSLPVGVEVGMAHFEASSMQLFVSAIDLGALAAVRFDGKSATSESSAKDEGKPTVVAEPTFASVFSPGVFLNFGLGATPLVLSVGAQISPAQRDYFVCSTTPCNGAVPKGTETLPSLRGHVMFGVDLPFLPVF